jgi:acyl-CoA synthetase (NDP forming)
VKLNLGDADRVRRAFQELKESAERQGAEFQGVAVQRMAAAGVELVLGAHRDPQWGPVILFGLGGIAVEVLKDVSMRVAPFDEAEATRMLGEIRARALLEGARGQAPVDKPALARALVGLSKLMLSRPDIVSLDLNPVFAYPSGVLAVDARVELRD